MIRIVKPAFCLFCTILLCACRGGQKGEVTPDTMTSGVASIACDESFRPIAEQEITVFENEYPLASVIPYYGSEVETMNLFLKDSVRLAITARPMTDREKESFKARKFYPREIKIAVDGIAVILNRENRRTLLSMEELRGILTGKIQRWKELDRASALGRIQVVFDNPNSSTVHFAIDSICGSEPLSGSLYARKNSGNVLEYVSRTPEAIGILGVTWVGNSEDTTRLSFADNITVAGISRSDPATPENSFLPYAGYLATGDYPLSRTVYVLLNDPRGGLISGFTTFLASFRGQRIIVRGGMAPATQPVRVVNIRDQF